MSLNKFIDKNSAYFYFIFRIIIGGLFLLHGIQILSAIIAGKSVLFSLIGLAGIIEFITGIFIIIGLLTRYSAMLGAVTMLVAYFKVHAFNALSPLANKGELALLFFAAFLIMIVFGSGKFSIESIINKYKR